MLRNTWKSVALWSLITTLVLFIAALVVNPNLDKTFKGIVVGLGALFVFSFFAYTLLLGVFKIAKDYKKADRQGRIILIVLIIMALVYLIPKVIDDLR